VIGFSGEGKLRHTEFAQRGTQQRYELELESYGRGAALEQMGDFGSPGKSEA